MEKQLHKECKGCDNIKHCGGRPPYEPRCALLVDADRESIGDDVDYGLEDIGFK